MYGSVSTSLNFFVFFGVVLIGAGFALLAATHWEKREIDVVIGL
jgi:hypothetical protein